MVVAVILSPFDKLRAGSAKDLLSLGINRPAKNRFFGPTIGVGPQNDIIGGGTGDRIQY